MLNISGKSELIKTVIYPTIQFWLQFTQFAVSIIQKINSICANFMWKSKAHKVNWDDVCKTKSEGGYGIRRIDEMAKAVVVKLLWNYIQGNSVWAKWMQSKYCKSASFWTATINNNDSYILNSMLVAGQWCKGLIDRKIVHGETTNIWLTHGLREHHLLIILDGIQCQFLKAVTKQYQCLFQIMNGKTIFLMFLHKFTVQYKILLYAIRCVKAIGSGCQLVMVNLN